jgi:hypothetical protein
MAYIGLGHLREARDFRAVVAAVASPSIWAKSALIAMAAAAAVLALSGGGAVTPSQAPQSVAAKKADRLAAPRPFVGAETATAAGYVNDPVTRTTTVVRGAATPISASSPLSSVR